MKDSAARSIDLFSSRRSLAALAVIATCASITACGHHETQGSDVSTTPAPQAPTTPRLTLKARSPSGALVLADLGNEHVAIVADEEAHAMRIVKEEASEDAVKGARVVGLAGAPGEIAVGSFVYVTLRDRAKVVAFAMKADGTSEEIASARTASEPTGIALTPDGHTVLVATAFGHTLEAFDAESLKPLFSSQIAREPRDVLVSEDGSRAFVSHAVGSKLSVVDLATPEHAVREVSLDMKERRQDFGMRAGSLSLPMPAFSDIDGDEPPVPEKPHAHRKTAPPALMGITFTRTAVHGMTLVRSGHEIILPETLAFPGNTTERVSTYGGDNGSALDPELPFVARVDEAKETLATDHISGEKDVACFLQKESASCPLPEAAATLDDAVYVACRGNGEIVEHRLSTSYDEAPKCFENRKKQRQFKIGKGARGIAIDQETRHLFAWSAFDRTLTELDLTTTGDASAPEMKTATLPMSTDAAPMADDVKHGRELFFSTADARISSDGRACASCHPDGREDGLVWPSPKGKRQTPMLAGRAKGSAPFDWNGGSDTLAAHIAITVKNLGGTGLPEADREALAAFIQSLPGPSRVDTPTSSSARVANGKRVFESADTGCASCHPSESGYSDHMQHKIAQGESFDTPSLAFVGGTAPYFHDGRYATLDELVLKCDGVMGNTKQLTDDERADLASYLRTL